MANNHEWSISARSGASAALSPLYSRDRIQKQLRGFVGDELFSTMRHTQHTDETLLDFRYSFAITMTDVRASYIL